jgi:hypothetical protein
MPYGLILVSLAYVGFAVAVGFYEARRTRVHGIDVISAFVVVFMLQCCLSAIAIYALLPFMNRDDLTTIYAFNKILSHVDLPTAFLVFTLTVGFLLSFYLGCGLGNAALERLWPRTDEILVITVGKRRISLVMLVGAALTLYSFMVIGETMLERYVNLILLRSNDPQVERTTLNANAFALTQAWSWLSIVAIFCFVESRWRRILLPLLVLISVVFAVLSVSRRALFLPLLMAYLTLALYDNRWKLRWVAGAALPLVVWVAFGKSILATFAYGGSIETVSQVYQSWQSAVVRASSDVGITVVESLGTVQLIDVPPRLGSDHVLSLIKLFPERTLGFEVDYPERIVRISTTALDGPDEADLPPGFMGQMWLDFRMAGPLVWGMALGLQISVLQWLFIRTRCTRQSSAILIVLVFIVGYPINTGSFDFTFAIDIVAIILGILVCARVSRARLVEGRHVDVVTDGAVRGADCQ